MWSLVYWIAVGVGTVALAFDAAEVWSDRERDRFYPEAVALYVLAVCVWCGLEVLVVVLSRAISPARHFWAGGPTAVVAGAAIVFFGAHLLAGSWFGWRHRHDSKPVLARDPSPQELAEAEAYDDAWQKAAHRHREAPRFADWQAEYLAAKKRRSGDP
jgi:hypothetical protein